MSEIEIQELRKELRFLQAQVAHLQVRVSELEGFEVVVSSFGGYEGPAAQTAGASSTPTRVASFGPETASSSSPSAPATEAPHKGQSWELWGCQGKRGFLETLFGRCKVGTSGRHSIALKSSFYITVKDHASNIYTDPVKA